MVNGLELMMLVCSVASSACWLHLDLSRPRALPLAPVSWGFLFTVPFDGAPGPLNAITEASGVQVGSAIPIGGEGALRAGQELGTHRSDPSPASRCERHRSGAREPGLARRQRRNDGNELGRGIGIARRAVAVTHAHSEGTVRNAMIAEGLKHGTRKQPCSLPVVAGTWEGLPNDINGFHVKPDDVFAGSRFGQGRDAGRGQYQQRRQLTIAGVPVGKNLPPGESFAEDQRYPPPLRVRRSPGSRPGA